jgi:hypothetical protein
VTATALPARAPAAAAPAVTAPPSAPAPAAAPATKRTRIGRVFWWSLALASLAATAVVLAHDRLSAGSSSKPQPIFEAPQAPPTETAHAVTAPVAIAPPPPAKVIAPPVEPAAAAAAPSPEPARAAEKPATIARAGSVSIESVLVGPTYERFTCPKPSSRFSLRSNKMVNVCLAISHRPERTDHVSLVWERNGAFYGKTSVEVPAKRPNVRTRAHMRIGEDRVGSWSVRVVSDRNATLAQTTFDVAP